MKATWKIVFLALIQLFSLSAHSQDQSLRSQAIGEHQSTSKTQPSAKATSAQLEGMLQLDEPYQELRQKKLRWYLGLSASNYAPSGKSQIADFAAADLSQAGATVMPSLRVGANYKLLDRADFEFSSSLAFSYSSQAIAILTPGGSQIDASLNSTVLRLESNGHYYLGSGWSVGLGIEAGQLLLQQTSANSFARFGSSQNFVGFGPMAKVRMLENTSLNGQYMVRASSRNQEGRPAFASNFELGIQQQW